MNYFKLICGAVGLFTLQGAFADCSVDRTQMYDQIATYGSINTLGCPFNNLGWGIVRVSEPKQDSENSCAATCTYAYGPGSNGKACSWELGNWGNTLTCN